MFQTHSVHRLFNKRGEGKTRDLAKTFWIVNKRGVQKRAGVNLKQMREVSYLKYLSRLGYGLWFILLSHVLSSRLFTETGLVQPRHVFLSMFFYLH